ncbi:MAG: tRNA pseudouridine synthase B [Candidatus Dichloromethanomonas elyunquensis]|nr:MAG: tRNA pseudouridine synthase B [Candidatus Dichloromethanomonas elyunquensis]
MDGIINVLKPVGMTSTDIVRWVLRKTKVEKAGHIGTLDPGAAGVLPVCVGKATRLAEYHTVLGKTYRAEITLGITTATQDAFGEEIFRTVPNISQQNFEQTLEKFVGEIEQIPPMYSAVKKNGRPLYEYARKGQEIAREKRHVTVHRLEMIEWDEQTYPKALMDIDCSKGTYIRTLCHDIGMALGCGAHMSFLLRLRAGKFLLESAYTLEEIEKNISNQDYRFLLNSEWGLELPEVRILPHRLKAFQNGLATGKAMVEGEIPDESIPVKVFCEGDFIGIGIWNDGCLCPSKVLC